MVTSRRRRANLTVPVTSGRGGRSSHSPFEDVELPLSRKISASFLTAGLTTGRLVTALLRFLELEEPPIVHRLFSSFIQQEGVVVKWAWRISNKGKFRAYMYFFFFFTMRDVYMASFIYDLSDLLLLVVYV